MHAPCLSFKQPFPHPVWNTSNDALELVLLIRKEPVFVHHHAPISWGVSSTINFVRAGPLRAASWHMVDTSSLLLRCFVDAALLFIKCRGFQSTGMLSGGRKRKSDAVRQPSLFSWRGRTCAVVARKSFVPKCIPGSSSLKGLGS